MNSSTSFTSYVGEHDTASPEFSTAISINKEPNGFGVVETGLVIDKVKIRYHYDGSSVAKNEYKQLHQFKLSVLDGAFGKVGKVWQSPKAALTSVYLPIGEKSGLFIRYGCVHKKLWSWVEFNPSKFSDYDMLLMSGCFETLFTNGPLTLAQRGQLARLDVAFDVRHASMKDYLFLDRRLRNVDLEYVAAGSLYLGSDHGKRTMLVYDKAKEQLEKQKIDHGYEWFRVESSICDPARWDFSDIDLIDNPLEHLLIVHKQMFEVSNSSALVGLRASVAAGVPLQDAYWHLPTASARKEAWVALDACRPLWWKPDEIWESYEQSLEWIDPFLGVHSPNFPEPETIVAAMLAGKD